VTDETDRPRSYGEMGIAIGEIACARAISPKRLFRVVTRNCGARSMAEIICGLPQWCL